MTRRVSICEVGPRDGLQNEPVVLAASVRARLVKRLLDAGAAPVEAGSMVRSDRVPQMAGAEEVVAAAVAAGGDGGRLALLVLNERGLRRALQTDALEIHVAYPVTDDFARRNQGTGAGEAAATAQRVVAAARAAGRRGSVTLGAAFGCPFQGAVDPGRVAELAAQAADCGSEIVVLADTIGAATPRAVRRVLAAVRGATEARIGLHLHNTRNAGYANAVAGLEEGVDWFDASVGGFGGCPFAPRATGNVATEDLAWILEREGAEHGLDIDALARTAEWLGAELQRPAPGLLHRAGRFPPSGNVGRPEGAQLPA